MKMEQVQGISRPQNNPADFQKNSIPTPLKALIIAVTVVASAALGFLLAGLTGLAIGALVGTGLGVMAIVIVSNFMHPSQMDSNRTQEVISVKAQAKKNGILTPKSTNLETQPPEIEILGSPLNLSGNPLTTLPRESTEIESQDLIDVVDHDLVKGIDEKSQSNSPLNNQVVKIGIRDADGNELEALPGVIDKLPLLPQPAELKIQDLTDITDRDSAEGLVDFYDVLPIDGKPQFDGSIRIQAKKIQAWMKESPKVLNCESIDLSYIRSLRLPEEISLFVHLKELNLSCNLLIDEELPAAIGKLSSLTNLDLSINVLEDLPAEMGNLLSLTNLSLSHNKLKNLPAVIGSLLSLTHLDLSGNWFEEIPAELANLPSLEEFRFRDNGLENYPEEFANFRYQGFGTYKKRLFSDNPLSEPNDLKIQDLTNVTDQ